MAMIEGCEPKEKGLAIMPLQTNFPRFMEVIKFGMVDLHNNVLEC
jgi:hypothetical protein